MLARVILCVLWILTVCYIVQASMALDDRAAFLQAMSSNPKLLAHLIDRFGPDFLDQVPGRLVNLQRLGKR
ncbi:unnamed protein product [Auanema sp. JU1783]|nr:unnamed protein product [Auanema sp. JU1783]